MSLQLGKTQRKIISYISRCGENGGYIGQGTIAEEFHGYTLEEIENSAQRLLHRNILRKEGVRYVLVDQ